MINFIYTNHINKVQTESIGSFGENTTFHGVRYFSHKGFSLKRR